MRRTFNTIVILCIGLAAFGTTALAQSKKLSSDDVIVLAGRSERRLDSISFRMTLKTEWFTERDGDLFRDSVETFATAQPDRYQSISEVGGSRIETVVVANRTFRRTGDSDWESVAVPPLRKSGEASSVARFGELAGGAVLPRGNGKFVSKGTIDGREVSMYEIRSLLQDGTPSGGIRTETTRYWIDGEGLIVRRVVEHEFVGDKRFMRATTDYSYTDIRIDEPILPIAQD